MIGSLYDFGNHSDTRRDPVIQTSLNHQSQPHFYIPQENDKLSSVIVFVTYYLLLSDNYLKNMKNKKVHNFPLFVRFPAL